MSIHCTWLYSYSNHGQIYHRAYSAHFDLVTSFCKVVMFQYSYLHIIAKHPE